MRLLDSRLRESKKNLIDPFIPGGLRHNGWIEQVRPED
jgi:hypothetical protein